MPSVPLMQHLSHPLWNDCFTEEISWYSGRCKSIVCQKYFELPEPIESERENFNINGFWKGGILPLELVMSHALL